MLPISGTQVYNCLCPRDTQRVNTCSYMFVDIVSELVVAREYAPMVDSNFDDNMSQEAQGITSNAATDQECVDIHTEVPLGTQSDVMSTSSKQGNGRRSC